MTHSDDRLEPVAVPVDEQLRAIRRGTVEIISEDELRVKLERAQREGRPLRVKLGMDPSAPDVHLGHSVVLRKLRQFQDFGHQVILIIGDFTGRIGDPTGKKATRPQLSEEQIRANAATYAEQVFKILDPQRTRIVYNNDWLGRLRFDEVIRLAATYTVARMLEREDFKTRYEQGRPISLHEFLYPLAQAYDSVELRADVELGGTDQKFNLMVVRDVQREYGQEPEVAVISPILVGTDGVEKMSKSLGNYIGLTDPPAEMYGKTMSIPDAQIIPWFQLLTDVPDAEIARMAEGMERGQLNPRDAKMRLARELVTLYHGRQAAAMAEEAFVRVFRRGELPEDVPVVELPPEALQDGRARIVELIAATGLASSHSEVRRLIRQGAVRLDGSRITDEHAEVTVREGSVVQ
ncbi:MAG TPA: tyrosine--tRNA ligase, partial [Bacillota bacterium]